MKKGLECYVAGKDATESILSPIFVHDGQQGSVSGHLEDITCISAGRSGTHSLAASSDSYVYAWGNNNSGQLGIGTFSTPDYRDVPHKVVTANDPNLGILYLGYDTGYDIIEVDAGVAHSLALDENGNVWEWGSGNPFAYRVTDGDMETPSGYLENIVEIASCNNSLALDGDGHVYQWSPGSAPTKVPGGDMETTYLEDIIAIGAGNSHFLALDSFGFVWQWSGNNPQLVSDGEQFSRSGYLENINAIDDGYTHHLAIDGHGMIYAWGTNNNGDFGTGDTTSSSTPREMICASAPEDMEIYLNKADNVNRNDPNNYPGYNDVLQYTLTYGPAGNNHNSTKLTDYLSTKTDYDSSTPQYSNFLEEYYAWVWNIGTLADTDPCSAITLNTIINESTEPLTTIANICIIETDLVYRRESLETPVGCFGGDVIYVDNSADGYNTGTSWANAYNSLHSALSRAANGCGNEIWIASGTYTPDYLNSTFAIPSGVSLYGGFLGNETTLSERHPAHYRTYLSGANQFGNIISIAADAQNIIIDGFSLINASYDAVSIAASCDVTIRNCRITDNGRYGIKTGNNNTLTVDHCIIAHNDLYGIYVDAEMLLLENCWIHHNAGYGIFISSCSSSSMIRNNTIVYNDNQGIYTNQAGLPYLYTVNNILWGNNSSGTQLPASITATDSCIENVTIPNNDYNIADDPCFAYADETLGNFHLSSNSLCIDAGNNTNVITGETDIDNEDRINGTYVDMGADEYYSCDSGISCTLDYNADGVVNLKEFALFEKAWSNYDPTYTGDPNTPNDNWDSRCDLDNNQYIDLDDLMIFVDSTNAETFGYWLWQACWYDSDSTAVAMMRTASIPEATILTDEQIESNRQAKWQKNQPEREYTTYETMLMVEDIIEIIENDWLTNPDFQKEVTEDQYKKSLEMLYDWLDELLTEWKSELSSVSKTAS